MTIERYGSSVERGNESRSAQAASVSERPSRSGRVTLRYSAGSTGRPFAQEVPVGIDFVLVHERRALAGEQLADVLQLGELVPGGRA